MGSSLTQSIIVVIVWAASCAASGWQPGTQYVYDYKGRVATGLKELKQQYAFFEITGRVIVQSANSTSLLVQFSNGRVYRTDDYQDDPYNFEYEKYRPPTADYEYIEGSQYLQSPFIIYHNDGVIAAVRFSPDDPLWAVNMKKAIASQLQLHTQKSTAPFEFQDPPTLKNSNFFTVYEDSVTGTCSTSHQVNRLPGWQSIKYRPFSAFCSDHPFYQVVKTRDYDHCLNDNHQQSTYPAHPYHFATANSNETLKRTSTSTYIACGQWPNVTLVHIENRGSLLVQPFVVTSDPLSSATFASFCLISKEKATSFITLPQAYYTNASSLAYSFYHYDSQHAYKADLESAPDITSGYETSELMQNVSRVLLNASRHLNESAGSDADIDSQLNSVRFVMPNFSLKELRHLWNSNRHHGNMFGTLFVDCAVASGTNPAIVFVMELIENDQISGLQALWTIPALGYYAKTPSTDLLHAIVKFTDSEAIRSSKLLRQTALLMAAELLNAACDPNADTRRFLAMPPAASSCSSDDSVIKDYFLPILVKELNYSESRATDQVIALTVAGTLATEHVLPVLVPFIHGNKVGDDTAQRVRSILSLHRIVYTAPDKVVPLVSALVENIAERPEVRMAAISILLTANVPIVHWQRIAYRTWFDPSHQVQVFTYNMLHSFAAIKPSSKVHQSLSHKARTVLSFAKPAQAGYVWSAGNSFYGADQDLGALVQSPLWKVSDGYLPVFFGHRWIYQLGPFVHNPLEFFVWNYNMESAWSDLTSNRRTERDGATSNVSKYGKWGRPKFSRSSTSPLQDVWRQLTPSKRSPDARASLLHVNLLGSLHFVYDFESLAKSLPDLFDEIGPLLSTRFPVSLTTFRNLAEIHVQYANELGLPTQFIAQAPILASLQGSVQFDLKAAALYTNVTSRVAFKLSSSFRIDLPFSGHYIQSGVEVRSDWRGPREVTFSYPANKLQVTYDLNGTEDQDFFYYHVKPYTLLSHNSSWADGEYSRIISVNDEPYTRTMPLPVIGLNVNLLTYSEVVNSDPASWYDWFSEQTPLSLISCSFFPKTFQYRKYRLRYSSQGSVTRSVAAFMSQYSYYKRGADHHQYPSSGNKAAPNLTFDEDIENGKIHPDLQQTARRLFRNVSSGRGDMFRIKLYINYTDASSSQYSISYGQASDYLKRKHYDDFRFNYTFSGQRSTDNQRSYSICANGTRYSNQAPVFGLSPDILYTVQDADFSFGHDCSAGYRYQLNAKLYRNRAAAKYAAKSAFGKQCIQDLNRGFYDTFNCIKARQLDHAYNVYELVVKPVAADYFNDTFVTPNSYFAKRFVAKSFPQEGNSYAATIIREPGSTHFNIHLRDPRRYYLVGNAHLFNFTYFYDLKKALLPENRIGGLFAAARTALEAGDEPAKCLVDKDRIVTYDGVAYEYRINDFYHVLVTDCKEQSPYAVMARRFENHYVVQVITDKDTVVVHPSGQVTINGAAKSFRKDERFEIYDDDNVLIRTWFGDQGAYIYLTQIDLTVLVASYHISVSSSWKLRGRACGLCGDANGEVAGEFKTASRCALSNGTLMAASFMVETEGKRDLPIDIMTALQHEKRQCLSVDETVASDFSSAVFAEHDHCQHYKPVTRHESGFFCVSDTDALHCGPRCNAVNQVMKYLDFKCTASEYTKYMRFSVPVPDACEPSAGLLSTNIEF